MSATCAHCRAELGDALVCPRCGHRVVSPQAAGPAGSAGHSPGQPDWRTDTIVRPTADEAPATFGGAPVEPAPAMTFPGPARYPLFADEAADTQDRDLDLAAQAAVPLEDATNAPADEFADDSAAGPPPDEAASTGGPGRHAGDGSSWVPWAIVAVVLVMVAVGGAWLLLAPRDDDSAADSSTNASEPVASSSDEGSAEASAPGSASSSPETSPSVEESSTPSDSPTAEESSEAPEGDPVDVASDATATAPQTAPPNQDIAGNPVTYVAANMLDGNPETCWRMPGDGTGVELRFALAGPTTLTRVGLINGYAKVALEGGRKLDWYAGNRRVLAATWVFDDGTTVEQPLSETKAMQTIDFPAVITGTVVLRLTEVSAPGTGRSARNYTAVSEVTLVGTTSDE